MHAEYFPEGPIESKGPNIDGQAIEQLGAVLESQMGGLFPRFRDVTRRVGPVHEHEAWQHGDAA